MKHLIILIFSVLLSTSCNKQDSSITYIDQEDPNENNSTASAFDNGEMRGLSSFEIATEIKAGWNLGNSLDAEGPNETHWGNPVTTRALIDEISNRGFNTVRVPVTWRFHQGEGPNYSVEQAWLNRVEEVVNYVRANDMYVIINVHHDDPWIIPTYENGDEVKDRLSKLWTQIANKFKNYSDYVIFETLNEPRHENTPEEWTGGTTEGRDMVNQYHKVSLDAIRATGGNNSTRHIMISTYAASTLPHVMDALVIPNNDSRTIISLHSYFPFSFTLNGTDSTWGSHDDKEQLDLEMDRIKTKFIDNGKPVILGEWSSGNQNNTADRLVHADYYANAAAERGMSSIWWDNGNYGVSNDGLGIFDRQNRTWPFGNIADIVIDAYN